MSLLQHDERCCAGSGDARASSSFLDSISITTPWVLAILGTAGALLVIGGVTLLVCCCCPGDGGKSYPKHAAVGKVGTLILSHAVHMSACRELMGCHACSDLLHCSCVASAHGEARAVVMCGRPPGGCCTHGQHAQQVRPGGYSTIRCAG